MGAAWTAYEKTEFKSFVRVSKYIWIDRTRLKCINIACLIGKSGIVDENG